MAAPTTGPCADWFTAADVFDCGPCSSIALADQNLTLAGEMVDAASRIMFVRSNGRYPGVCEDVVRPCRQGCGTSDDTWQGSWQRSWGHCGCGAGNYRDCGCGGLSEITLGGEPIVAITTVKVDGSTLAAGTDYRVDDHRWLVRLGDNTWPSCQDLSLASTQTDTFEVTFTWGRVPPADGILAAKTLACELYQACAGGECRLPSRVRAITRQGVDMLFHDPVALVEADLFGIPEIDQFLLAERYSRTHRDTVAVTPDSRPAVRRIST